MGNQESETGCRDEKGRDASGASGASGALTGMIGRMVQTSAAAVVSGL